MARCAKGQNHAVKYRNAGFVGADSGSGGSGGSARDTVVVVNPRVVTVVVVVITVCGGSWRLLEAGIGILRLAPFLETAVTIFDAIMLMLIASNYIILDGVPNTVMPMIVMLVTFYFVLFY